MMERERWTESFLQQLRLTLSPPVCVYCGTAYPPPEHRLFCCPNCAQLLRRRTGEAAWTRLPMEKRHYALLAYEYVPPLTHALRAYKFHAAWEKSPAMSAILLELWEEQWKLLQKAQVYDHPRQELQFCQHAPQDRQWQGIWPRGPKGEPLFPEGILAMPLHRSRQRKRGYNQIEEPVRRLSEEWGIENLSFCFERKRATKRQTETRDSLERMKNVAGAFACTHPDLIRGKLLLLVDDIVTSGATLASAVQTLEEAGAREVFCLAIAGNHPPLQKLAYSPSGRGIIKAPGRDEVSRFEPS